MPVVIYNPRPEEKGAVIRDFTWKKKPWNLGTNKIEKFPDELGEALLKTYGFLVRVVPENISEIRNRMREMKFKCPYCVFRTDTEIALVGHKKKHKLTIEDEEWLKGQIGEHEPTQETKTETEEEKQASIEKEEGITKENDFYGPGLEEDDLTDVKIKTPGKTPGVF